MGSDNKWSQDAFKKTFSEYNNEFVDLVSIMCKGTKNSFKKATHALIMLCADNNLDRPKLYESREKKNQWVNTDEFKNIVFPALDVKAEVFAIEIPSTVTKETTVETVDEMADIDFVSYEKERRYVKRDIYDIISGVTNKNKPKPKMVPIEIDCFKIERIKEIWMEDYIIKSTMYAINEVKSIKGNMMECVLVDNKMNFHSIRKIKAKRVEDMEEGDIKNKLIRRGRKLEIGEYKKLMVNNEVFVIGQRSFEYGDKKLLYLSIFQPEEDSRHQFWRKEQLKKAIIKKISRKRRGYELGYDQLMPYISPEDVDKMSHQTLKQRWTTVTKKTKMKIQLHTNKINDYNYYKVLNSEVSLADDYNTKVENRTPYTMNYQLKAKKPELEQISRTEFIEGVKTNFEKAFRHHKNKNGRQSYYVGDHEKVKRWEISKPSKKTIANAEIDKLAKNPKWCHRHSKEFKYMFNMTVAKITPIGKKFKIVKFREWDGRDFKNNNEKKAGEIQAKQIDNMRVDTLKTKGWLRKSAARNLIELNLN